MTEKIIYVCRCSAKKNKGLYLARNHTHPTHAPPQVLYTGKTVQAFMKRCETVDVPWAILSDKHGILLPTDKVPWYDLHPDDVTMRQFEFLLGNFDRCLANYDSVHLFYEDDDWHTVWTLLVEHTKLAVTLFRVIESIGSPDVSPQYAACPTTLG